MTAPWSILDRDPEERDAAVAYGEQVDAENKRREQLKREAEAAKKAYWDDIGVLETAGMSTPYRKSEMRASIATPEKQDELAALMAIDRKRNQGVGDAFLDYAKEKLLPRAAGAGASVAEFVNPFDWIYNPIAEMAGGDKHPLSFGRHFDNADVLKTPEAAETKAALDLGLGVAVLPALGGLLKRGALSGLQALGSRMKASRVPKLENIVDVNPNASSYSGYTFDPQAIRRKNATIAGAIGGLGTMAYADDAEAGGQGALTRLYRGINSPRVSENGGQLLSALPKNSQYNRAINMVPGSGWWTSNPRVADSYIWGHGGANSLIVPADMVAPPDLTLDAGGASWSKFFPNKQFNRAMKDPDVKSIMVNNVVDPGTQLFDHLKDLPSDMPFAQALDSLFMGNNALIKDPEILRYLSGEPVKYAEGGQVLKGLRDLVKQAKAASPDPRMNAFRVASRLSQASAKPGELPVLPQITDFFPKEEVEKFDQIQKLQALQAMGFNLDRPIFMHSQHGIGPADWPYFEMTPQMAEFDGMSSNLRRIVSGGYTPEEMKHSYLGQRIFKDRRGLPQYEREVEEMRKMKRERPDLLDRWTMYDSELGATYPAFMKQWMFDNERHLGSMSNSVRVEDIVPVFGGPEDVGKFAGGGVIKTLADPAWWKSAVSRKYMQAATPEAQEQAGRLLELTRRMNSHIPQADDDTYRLLRKNLELERPVEQPQGEQLRLPGLAEGGKPRYNSWNILAGAD